MNNWKILTFIIYATFMLIMFMGFNYYAMPNYKAKLAINQSRVIAQDMQNKEN